MQEEDFIKNKKVTKRLLAKKKLKEMTESQTYEKVQR
jgi:hypothetical protein